MIPEKLELTKREDGLLRLITEDRQVLCNIDAGLQALMEVIVRRYNGFVKSTPECRKACDVYESWREVEDANARLNLELIKKDALIEQLVEACEKAEQVLNNIIIPMGVKKPGTIPNAALVSVHKALAAVKEKK